MALVKDNWFVSIVFLPQPDVLRVRRWLRTHHGVGFECLADCMPTGSREAVTLCVHARMCMSKSSVHPEKAQHVCVPNSRVRRPLALRSTKFGWEGQCQSKVAKVVLQVIPSV